MNTMKSKIHNEFHDFIPSNFWHIKPDIDICMEIFSFE